MADYFTRFACTLNVGNRSNAGRACSMWSTFAEELDREGIPAGFVISPGGDNDGSLWIRNGVTGNPDHAGLFALRCARAFGLKGAWGFQWMNSCSTPRPEYLGGGALVLDLGTGKTLARVDTRAWLATKLRQHNGALA